ncbi:MULTISPECIES: collagen-like triple helix repeat-containing protein [unclassified Myroides]|uniref:collagen-like triple helix repeat-containing protein n=1 Tax=unclassified Myroides TaxID=2642485 RepID=UPI00310140FC
MKKKITTLFLLAMGAVSYAQDKPGIGIGQPLPSQAAMLDIVASNKGVLIPRIPLLSLTEFALEGSEGLDVATLASFAKENDGILIYNSQGSTSIPTGFYYWSAASNEGKGKWELVTSESQTTKILERITTVEKSVGVTPGGSEEEGVKPGVKPGEGGGTVIYRPGKPGEPGEPGKPGKPGEPGKIVIKDGAGNDLPIDIGDLLRESETNTFFKEFTKTVKEDGKEDKEVKEIYYFGESDISAWKKTVVIGTSVNDITKEFGKKLDIVGAVGTSFKEIIKENTKEITEVINNVEGNVTIVNNGTADEPKWEIQVGNGKDGEEGSVVFDLNNLETKTKITKSVNGKEDDASVKVEAGAGKVLYTYYGEDKNTPYYIDITADILTTLTTSKEIRDEIVKVINNPALPGDNGTEGGGSTTPKDPEVPGGDGEVETKPTKPTKPGEGGTGGTGETKPGEGNANQENKNWGNVYYGPVDPTDLKKGNVLYTLDRDGNKKYIDIATNIVNEIHNNAAVIEKIKEVTTVRVEPAGDDGNAKGTETGEVVDGKAVMKAQFNAVEVAKGNKTLSYNSEFNTTGFAVNEFSRLLSIQILDENGQLAMSTVTDVTYASGVLKFKFGVGSMYATLPAGKKYDVVLEYVSTKEVK